jgi:hypothetical protein
MSLVQNIYRSTRVWGQPLNVLNYSDEPNAINDMSDNDLLGTQMYVHPG